MQIQPFQYEDIHKIADLTPEKWNNIRPGFTFYMDAPFCYPIKITIDGQIVGLGATIVHDDIAWLGHIIVHPDQRGKGIGKQMTQALVDIAKQKHCGTIYLIATHLGFPVYEKTGFLIETEYLAFKDINLEKTPVSANIIPYQPAFKAAIASIDKITTGEARMMHLESFLETGAVYKTQDQVQGFYLPDLGEGLIVANNTAAGIELLKLHLQKTDRVVFPKENLNARDFLYQNGFKEYDVVKRMRIGHSRPLQLEHIYSRVSGSIG